jgi:hypothetical protein
MDMELAVSKLYNGGTDQAWYYVRGMAEVRCHQGKTDLIPPVKRTNPGADNNRQGLWPQVKDQTRKDQACC